MDAVKNPPVPALSGTGSVCGVIVICGAASGVRGRVGGAAGGFRAPGLFSKKKFLLKVLLWRFGGRGAHFFPLTVSEGLC